MEKRPRQEYVRPNPGKEHHICHILGNFFILMQHFGTNMLAVAALASNYLFIEQFCTIITNFNEPNMPPLL